MTIHFLSLILDLNHIILAGTKSGRPWKTMSLFLMSYYDYDDDDNKNDNGDDDDDGCIRTKS